MTIRTRLVVAAFVGSALVALAATASTTFLYRASSQLNGIHTEMLPMAVDSGKVADNAGQIAQAMEDFCDAKTAGDSVAANALTGEINTHFGAMRDSLNFLMLHVSSFGTKEHEQYLADADRLRRASVSLNADWSRLRGVNAGQPGFSEVTEFDDEAIRLTRSAVQLQADAVRLTSGRVDKANSYIIEVSRLSAIIAACTSIITLGTGVVFGSRLARRLIQVRNHAQLVGKGNLETTLETNGSDEIDDIAHSFNNMVHALRGSRDKLELEAFFDELTGLPNRSSFMQRLSQRLTEANRNNDHSYALFFLDVDRFKQVNDTLGHAVGDELLRKVAAAILATANHFNSFFAGSTVTKTVARLAGDEFTILLEGNVGDEEVISLGNQICKAIADLRAIDGKPFNVSASIGITMGDPAVTDIKQILARADIALYQVKRRGRNGCALFNSSMEPDEPARAEEPNPNPPQRCINHRARRGAA